MHIITDINMPLGKDISRAISEKLTKYTQLASEIK
jgi:hypothetical protein